MVWSVLKPLMLFAVMYVVFVKFLKFSVALKWWCSRRFLSGKWRQI